MFAFLFLHPSNIIPTIFFSRRSREWEKYLHKKVVFIAILYHKCSFIICFFRIGGRNTTITIKLPFNAWYILILDALSIESSWIIYNISPTCTQMDFRIKAKKWNLFLNIIEHDCVISIKAKLGIKWSK